MNVCTVGPNAVTGARCGAPAVLSFVGTDGVTYHECADHAAPTAAARGLIVGSTLTVFHCGVNKVGTIVKVGRSRVVVDVPTYGGKRTSRIIRPRPDIP